MEDDNEKQITVSCKVIAKPSWSSDGNWLLFQIEAPSEFEQNKLQSEVWAYHVSNGKKKRIFHDGYSPSWAPSKGLIAFNAKGILNISDFDRFYNIAPGVNSYTWQPHGNGFLLSSAGVLRPDGCTSTILFIRKAPAHWSAPTGIRRLGRLMTRGARRWSWTFFGVTFILSRLFRKSTYLAAQNTSIPSHRR